MTTKEIESLEVGDILVYSADHYKDHKILYEIIDNGRKNMVLIGYPGGYHVMCKYIESIGETCSDYDKIRKKLYLGATDVALYKKSRNEIPPYLI